MSYRGRDDAGADVLATSGRGHSGADLSFSQTHTGTFVLLSRTYATVPWLSASLSSLLPQTQEICVLQLLQGLP